MSDDREILATPMMSLVPGLVTAPEGAIDTMGERQGVLIGAQYIEGFGAVLFIGTRMKDGTSQIAAIPRENWRTLADTLQSYFSDIAIGDFDKPEAGQ